MTPAGFEIGETIAGHRIDAEIGRGGMGLVYRATHLRLGQERAIKVIAPESANDPEFRVRFERETKIAASIDHPHVAEVHDAGEGPAGQLYVVMRLVDGTDMDKLIASQGHLDPDLAAALIMQVASALDAAHALGLVHRDVKPANVLIGTSGTSGARHAFLTDFGLAKPVVSDDTNLTEAGFVVGTYDYMAPEQASGLEVGPAADVYALASTLFHALAGAPPFAASRHIAKLVAKVNEPAPRLSSVTAGRAAEFDELLERSLDRDPHRRHPSAGDLGRAALGATRRARTRGPSGPLAVGDVFAECRIEAVAGVGGMATVYRARQTKLGRTVALKVIAWERSEDADFRARFEREMEIAAAIDHPNVLPIHWAGEADGVLFIVMRFVDGATLRDELDAHGRLDPARAVDVVEQVAGALDAAHARGLIHRDVKPANVMIQGATGQAFLTDFGVAGATGRLDGDEVMGTARYIAPERLSGTGPDDARGDVYSLGCLLWDLLGGAHRPDLARVDSVPGDLAVVVARGVAQAPAQRFASAGDLAAAARAALEATPASMLAAPVGGEPADPDAALGAGLADRVIELCDELAALLGPGSRRQDLEAIRGRLLAPLRLAVVGPPGSGKSTLIAALPRQALRHVSVVEASAAAPEDADAFVYMLGASAGRALPAEASAVNAVAVLSHADARSDARLADKIAAELGRAKVAAVLPLAGLLARAGSGDVLGAGDVACLRDLALMDPTHRERLLDSADGFAAAPAPVAAAPRRRLLELLGLDGVRRALELADSGELTAVSVARWLREISGIEPVIAEIAGFRRRADVLKADRALSALERLPYDAEIRGLVRDRVEALRLRPEMHLLELIAAFERCAAGAVELPPDLIDELTRMMIGRTLALRLGLAPTATAAELGAAARGRVRSWKAFENSSGASARERRVARTVARSYEILANRLAAREDAS
jgi:serine/threonine protein kinase